VRTYKPREKTSRPCQCGCGREVVGTKSRRYFNPAHQMRAYRRRQASAGAPSAGQGRP